MWRAKAELNVDCEQENQNDCGDELLARRNGDSRSADSSLPHTTRAQCIPRRSKSRRTCKRTRASAGDADANRALRVVAIQRVRRRTRTKSRRFRSRGSRGRSRGNIEVASLGRPCAVVTCRIRSLNVVVRARQHALVAALRARAPGGIDSVRRVGGCTWAGVCQGAGRTGPGSVTHACHLSGDGNVA